MRFFEEDVNRGNEEEEETVVRQPQRLVEGINLKDLVKGKDVLFQINQDYDDLIDQDLLDDEYKEPSTLYDLRWKRGPSHINSSFSLISASMVSLDPQGYVKKEVIHHGKGSATPDFARVVVHYNFYIENDEEPFDSTYLRGKPCRLNLGQGEIIPGLEVAIKSMKKGENSRFLIKWEAAFGKQGCPPRIGKESDILADVTLLDYTEMVVKKNADGIVEDVVDVAGFAKVIQDAKKCHCLGNEEFGSGDVKRAIRSYQKCVKILNEMSLANEEEETKMFNLKVKCLVNLAICYNKIGRYEHACIVCREALSLDPNNVKATFQYGKANMRLSNLKVAEKWLLKAKAMKPEDKDITEEIEKLHLKKESCNLEDILFCQRAFGKLNVKSNRGMEN